MFFLFFSILWGFGFFFLFSVKFIREVDCFSKKKSGTEVIVVRLAALNPESRKSLDKNCQALRSPKLESFALVGWPLVSVKPNPASGVQPKLHGFFGGAAVLFTIILPETVYHFFLVEGMR